MAVPAANLLSARFSAVGGAYDLNLDEISIGDATLVEANFGMDVPPGAADADINADARINVQDLAIIGGNFGLSGCQTW